jgi:hypothetical protein
VQAISAPKIKAPRVLPTDDEIHEARFSANATVQDALVGAQNINGCLVVRDHCAHALDNETALSNDSVNEPKDLWICRRIDTVSRLGHSDESLELHQNQAGQNSRPLVIARVPGGVVADVI